MTSRDEHLEKFKAKLDEWNAEISKLEASARDAQADAKAQYEKQLASMRQMRDEAQGKFSEMQTATTDAWDAMAKGAENAWNAWASAFDEARSKFAPKD